MRRQIAVKHLFSACALTVTLVLAIGYLYSGVLGRSLTKQADTLTITLDETGGLFSGSGVTYRGVRVGTVGDIRLDGANVVVKASLDTDRRIPADSIAAVRSLSPAGEQFLDIQPRSEGPPYLRDGHLIGKADTATPTSVAKALGSVDQLVGQVDDKDVETILAELADAFAEPDDLGRLLTASQETLKTLDENWPATLRTLESGRTVLRTGKDKTPQFAEFATSSHSLAAWLRDYDPKVRETLTDTPAQLEQLRLLVSELALKMPVLLDNAVTLTDVAAARESHFRELLRTFPTGTGRLADTLHDGRFHVNMLVMPGMVCSYGNAAGEPKDTQRVPLKTDGACAGSFGGQQRGSAHTPPVAR
ncbi:MAG: MCE family protein [Actinomycetota bacterium]|nr:MCE family protein [Actinomycetota bacterium]